MNSKRESGTWRRDPTEFPFASLPIQSNSAFATNFVVSNVAFPPVFAGNSRTNYGDFDPTYPPTNRMDTLCPTFNGIYAGEVGDYDGIFADERYIYLSWADGRRYSTNAVNNKVRNQTDIRFGRISWPKM